MRVFSLVLLITAATTILQAAESPPNVVFIMVDDLGWSDVGFNGSKVYETPNVDRFASQGMVLSDFYSGGPVCSPTRASIMTGKYTARTSITTYLLSPARDAKHVQSHLPLEEFTIAEAFKQNGFATGYFGKWHLGYENDFWAGNQGFDVAKGGIDLPWAWTLCYPDIEEAPTAKTWPKTHTRFFSPYHLTHLENGPKDEYLTERLTSETIGFIEEHRDEPFFAFLSFHTVHTPLQAQPEKIEKYSKKIAALGLDSKKEENGREKAFQNNPAYAAMVEHMDENVGRLLACLDELKLSDNTIVVWTSDNGGKGSVTSNLPLRGMKHNLYEGGIRVPTIVRWPKRIAAGAKNATPLISNDFYPTLLELTGQRAEPQQHLDGVSFASVLLGKSETVDRNAIYWHYPHSRQEAAVREGQYKLLHRFDQDSIELYDLQADIGERTDLSDEKPEAAKRLLRKLKAWQESIDAKFEGDVAQRQTPKMESADRRPNVLFISVDDWNDWVGCLGHKQAQTPNVDRLASRGLLFTNAHCVAPACNPSRVATLTGLRPETTGVYENNHVMRRKAPDAVTLQQHFRAQGYHVVGGGKVFHDVPPHCDDPQSWDEYYWWNEHGPKGSREGNSWRSPYSIPPDPQPDGRPIRKITPLTKRNFDWGAVDQPESKWPDSQLANWAGEFLAKEHDKPFFLSVGIFRPHVPWFNPAKYVEKYALDELVLPTVKADDLDDLGEWAKRRAHDRNSRHDQLVEFGEWKPAVQAYLASISFADANVGRVLDALDKSPHRDNTIVVFWSDHGYHLGEKGHWHKRTLWERATHVPFIVAAPGVTEAGTKCSRPVSLLDIYPTLISLCGIDEQRQLEGNDLSPLLSEPNSEWDHAAVTTWQPGNHSVRTDDWRYIRYSTGEEELYDHRTDPNEWDNLAAKPKLGKKKIELAKHLPKPPEKVSNDTPTPTKTLAFVADGKVTGLVSAGEAWKMLDSKLVGSGKPNRLYASHGLGAGNFHVDVTLSLDKLNGTAAAFEIGANNFFGFEGAQNEFYLNGRIFGGRRRLVQSKEHLADGKPFRFQAIRTGDVIRFLIDGKELLKITHAGPLERLAFSPARATMRIERFVVTGSLLPADNLPKTDHSADGDASNDRPNILLLVSEDNGPELGCYGTPDVRTPHLDRLAAEGCRFANAYVPHPVCSASRAAFLTGLYPFQNGQIGLATHRYSMFRNWDNLPSILKAHGYRTGLMGKLHVNPESSFPFDFRWNESKANSFGSRNVRRVAEVAAEFFRETKQPFFLSLNFSDAHFPVLRQQNGLPEKPFSGEDVSSPLPFIGVDSPRLRQGTADYYNCMMRLDSGVGMVLDQLEKAGKSKDTLVIYIGDHGAQFSRGKATCYEGGLRIPMIVRWPEQVKPATVRDELVSTIDIMPTMIQAAALPARESLPGRSILPLAANQSVPWRKYLFAERTAYHSASFYPQRTLQDDRYKIIVNLMPNERNPVANTYETQNGSFFVYGTNAKEIAASPKHVQQAYATWHKPPPVELYDLKTDPSEFRNLADDVDLASVKQRLLDALRTFRERHNDPLLDADKLKMLAAEHKSVATTVKGGRYGPGEKWKYLTYLRDSEDGRTDNSDGDLSFSTVFARGNDGYPDYRIPSLVTARTGALLAFAEGRQTLSDHARNDIVVKRSTDNGKTWGPLTHMHQDDDSVLVNPCAVVLESGRVLVMYQRFPYGYHARAIGNSIKLLEPGLKGDTVSTTLISWSDDDGKTWSEPRDVTTGTKRAAKINSTATGPGQGIVLTRGKHKGRVVMPTNEGWWEGRDRFFNVYACYSDDGGDTWQFGESAPNGEKGQGNEVQMVELSDGSVMLNTRNCRGSGFRKTAISKDGGQTWSTLTDEEDHPESGCMGSVLRYSYGDGQENRLLFANPNSQQARKNGTVRMSFDDGKTWPVERVIYPGAYAYSCLTRLADGSIGLVFEADGYRQIKFVRLDLEWLMSKPEGKQ